MGCEDKTLIKKDEPLNGRKVAGKTCTGKERDPVNTHINADLSLSSSSDGSEKESYNEFTLLPIKVRASLSKRRHMKAIDIISSSVAAALDHTTGSSHPYCDKS